MGFSNRLRMTDTPKEVFNRRLFWSVGIFGTHTLNLSTPGAKEECQVYLERVGESTRVSSVE